MVEALLVSLSLSLSLSLSHSLSRRDAAEVQIPNSLKPSEMVKSLITGFILS